MEFFCVTYISLCSLPLLFYYYHFFEPYIILPYNTLILSSSTFHLFLIASLSSTTYYPSLITLSSYHITWLSYSLSLSKHYSSTIFYATLFLLFNLTHTFHSLSSSLHYFFLFIIPLQNSLFSSFFLFLAGFNYPQ